MGTPMDTLIAYLSLVSKVEPLKDFPGVTVVVMITGQMLLYRGTRLAILDPVEDAGCFGIGKVRKLLMDADV